MLSSERSEERLKGTDTMRSLSLSTLNDLGARMKFSTDFVDHLNLTENKQIDEKM